MANNKLTDRSMRAAKQAEKIRKLSDGDGLQLWVMPTGSKLWRLAYRHGGRQKLIALGKYPDVSLEAARQARDTARATLARGIDPSVTRKLSKANTFTTVADEWLEKQGREGRAPATMRKNTWVLSLVKPIVGPRPITEITAAECLVALQTLERSGKIETAHRVRSIMGAVFRYAIATARAENDPTSALRGALVRAPAVKHHAAITSSFEFGALLRAIHEMGGQPTTRVALMLCALLAPRPGELRFAEWKEFDLDAAVWEIPAAHTKMKRPHAAPLSQQAVALLRELHQITGQGRLVFPSIRDRNRPISDGTLSAALARLGYSSDTATPHGFRSTFSTLANESGLWNPDAVERHLAHVDGNTVRAAYARGQYWDERVRLAQWWSDRCDELREGGRVVPFAASA